ncbi:MAG: hypothetical protein CVT92_10965 [Bacteroidetes bacterium HGW-Bacteroidetes-1]|jgi:hypothetical protein|nr:MAG: hypothetical protein CVT92_10965 [Bacteroidetes bacterium HGW-Bacteroidetes-1]
MKKTIIILFVIVMTTLVAQSQEAKSVTQDSIHFVKTTHDYGLLQYGSDGSTEFKFSNKGNAPIVLTNVKAACGCTTPEWPRSPVNPGESAVIKVKYDTKRVGAFSKTIAVFSNAINSPVVLTIKGIVSKNEE